MFVGRVQSLEEDSNHPVVFDISAGSRKEGAHLISWVCHEKPNQRFLFGDDGVISTFCGMVLTASNQGEGAYIVQSEREAGNNLQLWDLSENGVIQLRNTELGIGLQGRSITLCNLVDEKITRWKLFSSLDEVKQHRTVFNICSRGNPDLVLEFRDSELLVLAQRNGNKGQEFSYNEETGVIDSPFINRVVEVRTRSGVRNGADIIHATFRGTNNQTWTLTNQSVIQLRSSNLAITIPDELQKGQAAKAVEYSGSIGQHWELHPLATQKSARK
mmetsp:Transcript_13269/g.16676  ORF Transcript_13269/g.16676 Transcript_13269/m.16676 type:complete len:273 (-) Transcript_13269:122-940(-)